MTEEQPRRPRRYLGLPRPLQQPRPSRREYAAEVERGAAEARPGVITKLVCQQRGCAERLAFLDVDTSTLDRGPTIRLAIRAPWVSEERQPKDVARIRLTGATSPDSEPMFVEIAGTRWPKGGRIVITDWHGHVSTYGAGHLACRLRAVLPSEPQSSLELPTNDAERSSSEPLTGQ